MTALALGRLGWHPIVLGADTPLASIEILVAEIRPALVLIAAAGRTPATRFLDRWTPPTGCAIVAGGPGFRHDDQHRLGGRIRTGSLRPPSRRVDDPQARRRPGRPGVTQRQRLA